MFGKTTIRAIERKLPNDFLPDHTTEEKVLIILGVWQDMRQTIDSQQEKFGKLIEDFEFTLNLLNAAENTVVDESLKVTINKWLDYYRNIANT